MLADNPVDAVLLATDLDESVRFWRDAVGLRLLSQSDDAATFACGGDSRIVISRSTTGTADNQTQIAFRVSDLAAELDQLRARGVQIVEYDEPGLRTVDGIFDGGNALHAWIADPGGNSVGIDQHR